MPDATHDLPDRYVALWNEPDPDVRRKAIRDLWAEDGAHTLLSPPQEIRDAADRLGFPTPPLEMRGHEQLDRRVTLAHDEFVAPGEHRFRLAQAVRVENVVTLAWQMVATAGGSVAGGGVDVLVLDDVGRIRADYQVIPG